MLHRLSGLSAAVVLTAAAGQLPADDKPAQEFERLQGTYSLKALEVGGKKMPAGFAAKLKYAVRDGKLIANVGMGKREDAIAVRFDPSTKPAGLEMEEDVPGKGKQKSYGIYKYENGTLTLCISERGGPEARPKEFKAEDPGKLLIVLQRDEPPKK